MKPNPTGREARTLADLGGDAITWHAGLVQSVVQQTQQCLIPGLVDRDDLVQDAWEGLLIGTRSFNQEQSALSGWLWMKAKGRIMDRSRSLRKTNSYGQGVTFRSIETPLGDEDSHTLADILPAGDTDPHEDVATTEAVSTLRIAVSYLPPRLRQVITLLWTKNKTSAEVADLLGISLSRVSQLKLDALGRLRETLTQAETWRSCSRCFGRTRYIFSAESLCRACEQLRRDRAHGQGPRSVKAEQCNACGASMRPVDRPRKGMCNRCYCRAAWRAKHPRTRVIGPKSKHFKTAQAA